MATKPAVVKKAQIVNFEVRPLRGREVMTEAQVRLALRERVLAQHTTLSNFSRAKNASAQYIGAVLDPKSTRPMPSSWLEEFGFEKAELTVYVG